MPLKDEKKKRKKKRKKNKIAKKQNGKLIAMKGIAKGLTFVM
jgi:hypothetical protein